MTTEAYHAKQEAKDAARELENFVNPFGCDKEAFVDQIVNYTHRTLQQSIGSLVFMLIKRWAECYRTERYDARNEATCQICHNICELMKEEYNGDWTYTPMI